MTYSKEKKKALGAFYTPQILSDLLARLLLPLCKISGDSSITALDPATGDSILLQSVAEVAQRKKLDLRLIGIDVDNKAIKASKKKFEAFPNNCVFINTDAIYPYSSSVPSKGWNTLVQRYIPNGIDLIVSNPPWGVDLSKYDYLARDFKTAIGQFDIYDIFIETILSNLNENGVYGIIVPDSIFCQEHQKTRELLLTQSVIKGIIRLGEGFFPDVNFAVSIIYGIKKSSTTYNVLCSHLSNSDRKMIMAGTSEIYKIVKEKTIKVPAKQMILSDYIFTVDVSQDDAALLKKMRQCDSIKTYATCQRGIELSKKGLIMQCSECGKWFPVPRKKKESTTCPHCNSNVSVAKAKHDCIITSKKRVNYTPLLAGEDIGRFVISTGKYIKNNVQGINYKSNSLYEGTKVVVRKTGVGITAGIDYNNSFTNQVVYILKPKSSSNPLVTAEVIAAVLCSRLLTYVIIKEKGSIGWTSNPYLSQKDVCSLPFPRLNFDDKKTVNALNRITELVRQYAQTCMNIPTAVDAEIEKHIADLYNLGQKEYSEILKTIGQVEQMIPFSRLMNINSEDIFQNGL